MERYPSYKATGVKWLGEIPSHWEVCRFKNLMSLVTTPSNDRNKIGLENIESGSGKFVQTENGFEGNGVHFQINDVVYGKLRPYLQKVWLATFSGNAVGDFFVFRVNNKVVGKYLQYLMLSRCFTDNVNASTYGAKMPRVSSEYILTMRCAVPSNDEQIEIVSYLDTATVKIDAAIAQQQKMIDLLNERKQIIINKAVTKGLNPNVKMKDSGVEWFGEVPEEWQLLPYRYLFYNLDKLRMPITADQRSRNNPQYDYYGASGVIDKIDYYNVDDKVLLIGEDGANLLLRNLPLIYKAEGKFWVNNHAHILKPIRDDYDFLAYVMEAADYTLYITGSAQPKLSQANLNCVKLPIPPLEEQKAIVDYLSKRTSKIDEAIGESNKMISLLQERKQIIINEVVTGKVKVV